MNETLTSFLVVFSEVGLLLALVAIVIVFFVMRRKHKDTLLARHVVETLRDSESARKSNLMDIMQKVHDMDEEFAEQTAQAMLASEKRIYNRVLKIFLGHERNGITDLQRDVENMATTYRKLIDSIKATWMSRWDRWKTCSRSTPRCTPVAVPKKKVSNTSKMSWCNSSAR